MFYSILILDHGLFRGLNYFKPDLNLIQNGFMSDFLNLKRGCRQGDPVSPYIFILCAEILGKMLRTHENVKGINLNRK